MKAKPTKWPSRLSDYPKAADCNASYRFDLVPADGRGSIIYYDGEEIGRSVGAWSFAAQWLLAKGVSEDETLALYRKGIACLWGKIKHAARAAKDGDE